MPIVTSGSDLGELRRLAARNVDYSAADVIALVQGEAAAAPLDRVAISSTADS